ncbi:MAG: hypothetical protein R2882_08960 [Gemmatimonadales bacterium]
MARIVGARVRVKVAGRPASRSASELKVKVPYRLLVASLSLLLRLMKPPILIRCAASAVIRLNSSDASTLWLFDCCGTPESPPKVRFEAPTTSSRVEITWTRPPGNCDSAGVLDEDREK